jgi:hypothetical protein
MDPRQYEKIRSYAAEKLEQEKIAAEAAAAETVAEAATAH